MEIETLVNQFEEASKLHHMHTLQGEWRKGNREIRRINDLYSAITLLGESAKTQLLSLVDSPLPEVASMAAIYCMRFDPEKCLCTLRKMIAQNIPHFGIQAGYAIKNWESGNWNIG